ncbi:MAG: reverse transcriptase domain-containing protein [Nostocales cyanobacterium ELA608]
MKPTLIVHTHATRANNIITTITNMYDEMSEEGDINEKQRREAVHEFLMKKSPQLQVNEKEQEKKQKQQQNPAAEAVSQRLQKEFKDILPETLPAGLPPSRGHELRITLKPNSKPPSRVPPRTSYKHVQFETKWIQDMLDKKLIRKSQSEFAAPHFYVEKPETETTGEYRAVTDFRGLNDITVKNKYPLPRADELFDRLANAKFFSKIDLRTGFYQILIAEADRHKTAFTTSQGLFEYNVLPMGLCNSPAIFMQLMNDTFREELNKSVLVFLDDIVVYSNTLEEHERHLRQVFKKLREQRLYVKLSKSELCREEVEFLGHYVGKNGIRVMQDKIEAIQQWPQPKNLKELRAFLGLAGYYRRFVKGYSDIALPLSDLIRTSLGSRFSDHWSTAQDQAFSKLKQALAHTPVLDLPDPQLPYVIHCDASGYAVGAVLQQDKGTGLRPISFMSKKMNAAETRYPVHEQELLAIITALDLWRHHLEGTDKPIRIRTDHKSLIHFQTQPMLSGRQTRWIETLSRYNYEIEYIKGEENVVADALSRRVDHNDGSIPLDREPLFVDKKQTFELNQILTVESRAMLDELQSIASNMRQHTLQQKEERRKANDYAMKIYPAGALELPSVNKAGVRVTPTQRCVADNAQGDQCGAKTAKGRYCHNHMRLEEGLRVTKSTVAKAGFGLFAARDFEKGQHVADYTGDQLMLRADQDGGEYVLQMTKREGIDAARTNTGYGRWANDPKGSGMRANTEFVVNHKHRTGRLRTTRAVKKGEELFVSYGPSYWKAFGPQAQVIVKPAAEPVGTGAESDPIVVNTIALQSKFDVDDECRMTTREITEEIAETEVVAEFSSSFVAEFEKACETDKNYQNMLENEETRKTLAKFNGYRLHVREGRLWKDGRLWVPDNKALRTRIIRECHDSPLGGHLGREKTIGLIAKYFVWTKMAKEVGEYVTTCDQCQRNKPDQRKTAGELMPIPSPTEPGHTWTMDMITGLPPAQSGNDAIVVWVCKLTKLRHYTACKTAIDAPSLAKLFMRDIVRLHGLPKSIISDRDPRFTAHFWKEFWNTLGTTLNMSTAFHPQSDGQTENANKVLEIMLRPRVDFDQTDWDEHLAAAELAINNAKNETTGYSPFYLFYGRDATLPMDIAIARLVKSPDEFSKNPAAVEALVRWQRALLFARSNTVAAQKRQKKYADQHRREEEFQVGDKVLLSTAHLKLLGEAKRAKKFTERYIGAYRIKRVVNKNSYELELPPALKIHPVINVSQLKRYQDGSTAFPDRPIDVTRPPAVATEDSGAPEFEVERIVDHRKAGRRKIIQYLVKWKGYPMSESTWEPVESLDGALDLVVDYNQKKHIDLGVIEAVTVMQVKAEQEVKTSSSLAVAATVTLDSKTVSNKSQWSKRPEALWSK